VRQLASASAGASPAQLTRARSLPVPAQNSNYHENGRLYHGFRRGIYMYPCDEVSAPPSDRRARWPTQAEKDRMDIYHKLFTVARRDQLHQAPVPSVPQHGEPPRILDVGCGTGIWAIDMAE
jgi:SAM-dependent methyltransferase